MKIKNVFENAIWWSGVATVGIVLGISLQFVKAWAEPDPNQTPPNGNVGAPINTGLVPQNRSGLLGLDWADILKLTIGGDTPDSGDVLTAVDTTGKVAWAAPGGGSPGGWNCEVIRGVDCRTPTACSAMCSNSQKKIISGGCEANASDAYTSIPIVSGGKFGWQCETHTIGGVVRPFAFCCE